MDFFIILASALLGTFMTSVAGLCFVNSLVIAVSDLSRRVGCVSLAASLLTLTIATFTSAVHAQSTSIALANSSDNDAFTKLKNDKTAPYGFTYNASHGSIVSADPLFTIEGQVSDEETHVTFVLAQVERIDVEPALYWNGHDWQESSRASFLLAQLEAEKWSLSDVDLSDSGTYSVRFSARDRAGNVSPASDNVSIFTVADNVNNDDDPKGLASTVTPTVDTTAPAGVTNKPANSANVSTNVASTIEGKITDDESGVTFVLVQLERQNGVATQYWNGVSWQDSSRGTFLLADLNGENWSLPAVNLAQPGTYIVRFSARDRAGNVSPSSDNTSIFTVEGKDLSPITIASIGQGTLDAERNVGPSFMRIDFDSLAAAEHTIRVAWDGNADIQFTVNEADGAPVSPVIQGLNPGIWTGFLENDKPYFLSLSSTNGKANFTASIEATVALSISAQPVDATVTEGNTARFSVIASGSGNLNYQWLANGIALAGETESTLAILNTTARANNTRISVQVSNGIDTITSDSVTLTVDEPIILGRFSLQADTSTWMLHGPAPTVDFEANTSTDGWGKALLRIDNLLLVGGDFSGIKPSINGPVTDRPFLAALDAVTGQPVSTFEIAPEINAVVRALLLSPDGNTVYVGGDFGLLALNATTGQLNFAIEATDVNGVGRVFDIAVTNTELYIGGAFTNINGSLRANIARLSLNGELDESWSPNVGNGFSNGRAAPVQALALSPAGDTVYIGGNFRTIDDTPVSITPQNSRISMLAISALDGTVRHERFSPDVGEDTRGLSVNDILVTDNYVILAWGGPNYLSFHLPDGTLLRQFQSEGDVQRLQIFEDLLFVGHHGEFFGYLPNPIPQAALVSASPRVIQPFKLNSFRIDNASFEPERAWPIRGSIGVWGIAATEESIWIAGNITNGGTNNHRVEGLVRFFAE